MPHCPSSLRAPSRPPGAGADRGDQLLVHFLLSRALVATLQAFGLSVTTGTLNHAAMLEPLLPLGLDAVTSDSPHELRRALSRAREALSIAA
jgi:hypothetical protein